MGAGLDADWDGFGAGGGANFLFDCVDDDESVGDDDDDDDGSCLFRGCCGVICC